MRAQPLPGRLLLLVLAVAPGGCDNLDVGRAPAGDGAPVIDAIWVLDAARPTMIDLLRRDPPAACSDREPCPSSGLTRLPSSCVPTLDGAGAPLPGGAGTCDDPTAASNRMSGGVGGASVRVVLSRLLDPATVEAVDLDGGAGAPAFTFLHPGALRLLAVSGPPGDGVEVAAVAAWDPAGAATSSDPYVDPPGPALTLTPLAPLSLGQEYAVVIDPAPFADRDGGRVTATRLGPIDPAGYRFRVEEARLVGTLPGLGAASPPLAPNQVVTVLCNAPIVEAEVQATLIAGDGARLALGAWLERGASAAACADSTQPTLLDVFPVDKVGVPAAWTAGRYTLALRVPVAVPGARAPTVLELTVPLQVGAPPLDPSRDDNIAYHLTPAQCQ